MKATLIEALQTMLAIVEDEELCPANLEAEAKKVAGVEGWKELHDLGFLADCGGRSLITAAGIDDLSEYWL